jgi:pimeloyl-ACP methyl ester carboxylesterase
MTSPMRVPVPAGPVRLSALDYGNVGAPPMLLVHGHADLAWSMDSIAQAFCDQFRVVSMDLRGHGESDHPGAYSILHMVADLRATLAHFAMERPVLVAHSLGGHVAAQFAGLYPDALDLLVLVEGLGPPAKMTTTTDAGRDDFVRAAVELLSTPLAHRPLADVDAAAARLRTVHPRLSPERAAFLAAVATRPGPEGGVIWSFDPRTRDWIASVDHNETERHWRAVRCPVLVVTGAEAWDTWWGARLSPMGNAEGRVRLTEAEWSERLTNFADVEAVELGDAGHLVHYDQPERLNQVIADFLRRRLAPH